MRIAPRFLREVSVAVIFGSPTRLFHWRCLLPLVMGQASRFSLLLSCFLTSTDESRKIGTYYCSVALVVRYIVPYSTSCLKLHYKRGTCYWHQYRGDTALAPDGFLMSELYLETDQSKNDNVVAPKMWLSINFMRWVHCSFSSIKLPPGSAICG